MRALNIYTCVQHTYSGVERDSREQADKRCQRDSRDSSSRGGKEEEEEWNLGTAAVQRKSRDDGQDDEEDEGDGCGSSDCGGRRRVLGDIIVGELQKRAHIFWTLYTYMTHTHITVRVKAAAVAFYHPCKYNISFIDDIYRNPSREKTGNLLFS